MRNLVKLSVLLTSLNRTGRVLHALGIVGYSKAIRAEAQGDRETANR